MENSWRHLLHADFIFFYKEILKKSTKNVKFE